MKPLRAPDQGGTGDLAFNGRALARLLATLDDGVSSLRSVADLVLCDPVLALQVLVAAGPAHPVAQAAPAVSMELCLGVVGRDILGALAFIQIGKKLRNGSSALEQSVLRRAWARSILCAELAARMAGRLDQPAEPAHLAGLLHQIGKLVLLRSRGGAYVRMVASARRDIDLLRAELEAFETTHDSAGAAWVEGCGLHCFVADALRFVHQPLDRLRDAPYVVRAVRAASVLAEQGLTAETRHAAREMIGLEASATERLFEEATAAARANPAGIPIFDSDGATSQETEISVVGRDHSVVEGDLSLQIPLPMGSSVAQEAVEVVSAFARTGAHQILRQALADVATQEEALSRIRRLIGLLTGLRRHYFFLRGADGKRLTGIATGDDPDSLAKLAISLEGSPSLLARAAMDLRPARATGPALDDGVAIDRVLARMLNAGGLLCLPMVHEASTLGVIAIGLPSHWEEPAEEQALLAWLASLAAQTLSRIGRRSGNEERMRTELTERFRSAGKRIVHEVGNPLTIVKNYLKLLGDKLGEKARFHEELTILNEELDRVTRIVQRMNDPLAIELEEPARLDLNSVVHELMTLCRDTLFGKRGIEVVQQLDPQLPLLHADVGAIKQVALNVLTNAAEAMPNGGRLGVMTADSVNFGGELFVLLQVSDSGNGVPPEVMQKLFQPGTSTKGAGHEGIGLTESAAILKRLGGQIVCRSSVGRGTIFLILLPRRVHSAAAEKDRPPMPEAD